MLNHLLGLFFGAACIFVGRVILRNPDRAARIMIPEWIGKGLGYVKFVGASAVIFGCVAAVLSLWAIIRWDL